TFDGTTGAEIQDNVITLHLVDGGRGDADGVANGVIVDPGGPGQTSAPILAAGDGAGRQVRVYDAINKHAEKFTITAYSSNVGVRVGVGDVNGDGYDDVVTGPGKGGGSQVRVFSGKTGEALSGTLGSFNAFTSGATDGVFVAAGDVNGDGKSDIIVGTEGGATTPKVRVFSGADASQMFELSLESDFNGGVRVAGGDVNGDGYADVVVAAGPGGPPRVCVFDGKTHMVFQDFFADSPSGRAGLQVAAGDLDNDAKADIATASEGGSTVRVFRGSDNASVNQFSAFNSES